MHVSAEALGIRSAARLIEAGAEEILIPCTGDLDEAIDKAAGVPDPVTVHVPANRVDDVDRVVARLDANGIHRALVVSGNPGHGEGTRTVYELIERFRGHGIHVSVGAYPESYFTLTSSAHRARSAAIVLDKQAAGAERVITQASFSVGNMQASFSVGNMQAWLRVVRARGVVMPVHVGVMVRVPRRVFRAVMRNARAEVFSHPRVRAANRVSLDLFLRMLRSRLPDSVAFVRQVGGLPEMGGGDGFHVFSYGADATRLITAALALSPPHARQSE